MTPNGFLQIGLLLGLLALLSKPLGSWMARIYDGESPRGTGFLRPIERLTYRLSGVRSGEEMTWRQYAHAVVICSGISLVVLYLLQRAQPFLPGNPHHLGAVAPAIALNTAISFVSNTNWQAYGGETTMSYATQMAGLAVQNFVSAAAGMAVLAALIRGLARHSTRLLGNFWVDLVRGILYILLPLSLVLAVLLVSQGVVQTLSPGPTVTPLDGAARGSVLPVVAVGPAASQIAVKQLGTNGGGFFNANSAHPLENPTPLSNFLELLAILLIPAASCHMFGRMIREPRQGWAVLAAMTVLFLIFLAVTLPSEQAGTPVLRGAGLVTAAGPTQAGGNMEGKEVRFGITNSAFWAVATTAASNGSVNAMHDSFTPLGGLAPMVLMQLGEVVFGGVGSGLYGMLVFAVVTVFVAGLMVGRTPEYLGKKIEIYEMKTASLIILIPPLLVLIGTALAVLAPPGASAVTNPGPHAFSEILYALSSAANNNGSAFAGLDASGTFYCLLLGVAMFVGRFWIIVPTLALAGSLAAKKKVPAGEGTLPTHGWTFILLLASIVLVVGSLTYFPALALGPVAEALRPGH